MAAYANEVKLFGKWSYEGVSLDDISLEDFIAVKPKDQVYLPHTAGRYQVKRFRKAQCPIVERLCNALMRKGRNNGKKLTAVRIVQQAFEIIHLLTDENPLQVYVRAIVNAGPREDSTRVGAGGIVRRQAVDVSPFRRVNQAIYLMGIGVSGVPSHRSFMSSRLLLFLVRSLAAASTRGCGERARVAAAAAPSRRPWRLLPPPFRPALGKFSSLRCH
jgi:small subunit ribosomal protein S5e